MAPLMSELQRDFLKKMLRGVISSVSDFPLGAGFPGYGQDMYSPKPFQYGYQSSSGSDGHGNHDNDNDNDNDDDPWRRKGEMMTPGVPESPFAGPTPAPPDASIPIAPPFTPLGPPPTGGQAGPTPLSWFSMLNQQDPMATVPQMLTTPFMDPWRYGLTGNYPRKV